jgi:zinc protease
MPTKPPTTTPITTTDAKSGISETKFANGLTLLVVPQPENPAVACTIWYSVGSRDEDVGETGLSHYLEHMMFKGTAKYPKGAIDKVTQRNGGSNNATTWYDRTEYHFTFPAEAWPAALEIESDRMRGSDVQPAEFDAEKNVVLQELKRNLGDPSDVLWEAVAGAAFRSGGYHAPVIGWPEDVISTTRERMKAYYLKHYTPDRATIVIVGGVDRQAVIDRVAASFSSIPRGNVTRHEFENPPPQGETRVTIRMGKVPRLQVAFRGLSVRDAREPWLDLLTAILAGDKTTRLEKALVDTGLAASVSCYNDSRRDAGLVWVDVDPSEGHGLDECEKALRASITELVLEGLTEREVALAKAKTLAAQVFSAESSFGLADRLGGLASSGDWRYHLRYPERLAAATPAALRDLAKEVLDLKTAVVGRGLPKDVTGDDMPASGGHGGGSGARRSDREVPHRAPARDAERGGGGGGGAVSGSALDLKPEREVLGNGLVAIAIQRSLAPVAYASLQVRDGRLRESAPGLDALVSDLLEEGTTVRSGEEVAATIGAVGGTLSVSSGSVSAKVLSKDAKLALSLVAEVATKPAFAPDAIERVRAQQMQEIEQELETPRARAQRAFDKAVYGAGHPLGRSPNGTKESVAAITRDQVVAHHRRVWTPRNACLVVVSDRDPKEMLALAREAFGSWSGEAPGALSLPAIPAPSANRVRVEADEAQTNVLFGHVGIVRTDPDYAALEVMDNVLGTGAGFTDRLSKNVRDDKGLAYTVFGNITGNSGVVPGTFRVYAGTNPGDASKALAEMRKEVAGIVAAPPTDDEVAGAKAALKGGMVTRLETASDVATVLQMCERYGLGFDYPRRYLAEVERVTPDDVLRVAKAHLRNDAFVEVVVGKDAESVGGK